jgi:hypothetical protein
MKKIILKIIMMFAIAMSFYGTADAQQFTVKVRPHHPVVKVRPPAPSRFHVWVSGEWTWNNGRYDYHDGYWERPGRGYSRWVDGYWKHTRRGWYWVPGHWSRRGRR